MYLGPPPALRSVLLRWVFQETKTKRPTIQHVYFPGPTTFPSVPLPYLPVHVVGDPFQVFLQLPNFSEEAPSPLLSALFLGQGVEPLVSPQDAQNTLK